MWVAGGHRQLAELNLSGSGSLYAPPTDLISIDWQVCTGFRADIHISLDSRAIIALLALRHFYFTCLSCSQVGMVLTLNSSHRMSPKGRLFEFLLHPRTVEEFVARRVSAPSRWIRMFDIQVKLYQDSAASNSQARDYWMVAQSKESNIREFDKHRRIEFLNDIVDSAVSIGWISLAAWNVFNIHQKMDETGSSWLWIRILCSAVFCSWASICQIFKANIQTFGPYIAHCSNA